MKRVCAALVLFAVACTPAEEENQPQEVVSPAPRDAGEATAQDTCGGSAYHAVLNTPAASLTAPSGARVIAPDTPVTDDFVPERLNFIVDAEGVVRDIQCY